MILEYQLDITIIVKHQRLLYNQVDCGNEQQIIKRTQRLSITLNDYRRLSPEYYDYSRFMRRY